MPTPDELEDRAAAEATEALRTRLEEITRRTLAAYESMDEGETGEFAREIILITAARQLTEAAGGQVVDAIAAVIRAATAAAWELSAVVAARSLGVAQPETSPSASLDRITRAAAQAARDELTAAAGLLGNARDADDVLTALTQARRSVTRTEAAARFAVNRALSEGTTAVAEEHGASRLWIPERDACVHCLAYAGEVAAPGKPFRGGLTFGRKPLVPAGQTLPEAPLHPNCRCRVVVYRPEWDEGNDTPRPEALKREALRSILRGFSMESESPKVRLDAAERALKNAGKMPKSVQDYARRAVRTGKFPRGRAFPRSEPLDLRSNPQLEVETKRDDPFDQLPKKKALERRPATKAQPPKLTGIAVLDQLNAASGGTPARRAETRAELEKRDRDTDIAKTNPRYETEDPVWRVNCQRVAVAFELRRRGFDVAANPNDKRVDKQYRLPDMAALWRTVDGETVDWEEQKRPGKPELDAAGLPATFTGQEELRKRRIIEQVKGWGPGARGWIVAYWKAGGAHIWNVEVDSRGIVHWIDAQPGRELARDGEPHFGKARDLRLLRVDDLIPGAEMIQMVQDASAP